MYRNLAPRTLSQYSDGLLDVISLFLRYRHVAALGKVDYGQSEINLHLDKRTRTAGLGLYDFLVSVECEDEIPRDELAVHIHRFLVHLLTSQAPSSERMGGLFDFVIALRSYIEPTQGFGPPTIASRYCSIFQYGLRTIVVHIARLGGGKNAYEIEEPAPTTGQSQEEMAVDSDNSSSLPDLEDCDPLDIDEGELDELIESEEEHGPIPASPTIPSISKDSSVNDAASAKRILDPFLADAGDEEGGSSEVPDHDLNLMKKDDLLA